MSDPFDRDIRELLADRARVSDHDLEPHRRFIRELPPRRARSRRWLMAAAGILVALGLGGVLVSRLPLASTGTAPERPTAAPTAPNPAAFAGDPRLAVCGVTPAGATAIFELAHVRDYARQLPAAYPLIGLQADLSAPALVIVRAGPGHPERGSASADPGTHDLCMVVGADPASWAPIAITGVDTTGLVATLPNEVAVASSAATGSPTPSSVPIHFPPLVVEPTLPPQLAPAECAALSFSVDRCLAVVERALTETSLEWPNIVAVHLAPPAPGSVSLGSHAIAEVTFELADGSTMPDEVRCLNVGSPDDPVCNDRPQIMISGPMSGYRDVPCGAVPGGEPGSACATPLPSIDPAAARRAVPLEIASRDIPITATGHLEIDVGSATLPNGALSDARFSLADPSTRAFTVADGITLEVRSRDPGRPPFDNAYEHGWYPGTEDVEVYLVLDVTSFTPGAQLQVRDLVVR